MGLERARDLHHLAEVARHIGVGQLGEVGDVTASPDDDRVAGLTDVTAHQVGVRHATAEDASVAMGLVGPAFGAHWAPLAGLALLPVLVPGTDHVGNGSVPTS